jgi:hypothetical protein
MHTSFLLSQWKVPYMDFLLLLRISKVSLIVETLEDNSSVRDRFGAILDLGKLICINIFISHLCACAWHYIGILQVNHVGCNYKAPKLSLWKNVALQVRFEWSICIYQVYLLVLLEHNYGGDCWIRRYHSSKMRCFLIFSKLKLKCSLLL